MSITIRIGNIFKLSLVESISHHIQELNISLCASAHLITTGKTGSAVRAINDRPYETDRETILDKSPASPVDCCLPPARRRRHLHEIDPVTGVSIPQ